MLSCPTRRCCPCAWMWRPNYLRSIVQQTIGKGRVRLRMPQLSGRAPREPYPTHTTMSPQTCMRNCTGTRRSGSGHPSVICRLRYTHMHTPLTASRSWKRGRRLHLYQAARTIPLSDTSHPVAREACRQSLARQKPECDQAYYVVGSGVGATTCSGRTQPLPTMSQPALTCHILPRPPVSSRRRSHQVMSSSSHHCGSIAWLHSICPSLFPLSLMARR